ncbi:MAG TPA: aminopeptidase [Woeseiaceae bacterium]
MHKAKSILLCLGCLLLLHGCYYMQAARGHLGLMQKREPITHLLQDPGVTAELKDMLTAVQAARRFSVERMALPDNDSYTDYVQTGKPYVVWNVFATREFSLEPELSCFPVAGCVGYRGYFAEEAAIRRRDALAARGLDVTIGGVSAYSTLGRFADPVLDTMARHGRRQLVETVFHELAHQRIYVKGDTRFNESFATAVATLGMEEWLHGRGDAAQLAEYREQRQRDNDLQQLISDKRLQLKALYDSDADTLTMRAKKRAIFVELAAELREFYRGPALPDWFAGELNNATLLPFNLYGRWQPAFASLFVECERDFACLYARADQLAALPADERHEALERMLDKVSTNAFATG